MWYSVVEMRGVAEIAGIRRAAGVVLLVVCRASNGHTARQFINWYGRCTRGSLSAGQSLQQPQVTVNTVLALWLRTGVTWVGIPLWRYEYESTKGAVCSSCD
jgi:hypothetical protein